MSLLSTTTNVCPPHVIHGLFKTEDGLNLRYARWANNRGSSLGTVCIFTGRGEFIEKYFEVVGELRRRGFSVALFDWRGQGGSEHPLRNIKKGHVTSFKKYDLDLQSFMQEVVLPHCPAPYISLGHSMGATLLLRNLGQKDTHFVRAILTAPMLGIRDFEGKCRPKLLKFCLEILWFLGFSRLSVPSKHRKMLNTVNFETNPLTSDFIRWTRTKEILEAAPHLKSGPPTFGWTRAALRAIDKLHTSKTTKNISLPVLMFTAGADSIVCNHCSERFSQIIKNSTVVFLKGSQHEILQEQDLIRLRFWAAFDAFMGI